MTHAQWIALLFAFPALVGCGTDAVPPPIIEYREVPTPVRVPCVPADFPAQPNYPDSDQALLAAAGADVRYQLMQIGRELRKVWGDKAEVVIDGCR